VLFDLTFAAELLNNFGLLGLIMVLLVSTHLTGVPCHSRVQNNFYWN